MFLRPHKNPPYLLKDINMEYRFTKGFLKHSNISERLRNVKLAKLYYSILNESLNNFGTGLDINNIKRIKISKSTIFYITKRSSQLELLLMTSGDVLVTFKKRNFNKSVFWIKDGVISQH